MTEERGRRVELTAAEVRALDGPGFVRVELGAPLVMPPHGLRARSAFVGRAGGRVVAWANLCQHNPAPLDLPDPPLLTPEGVRRAPMADDGHHLVCHSHGAMYRPSDGLCVLGPCYGQRLFAVEVEEEDGRVTLLLP
jgi:nitrite reductase/ring-hydroxylating ferredoxin subunit